MLSANFRKERSIRNILSQSLSSSKFEVFLFSVHGFGNMLMFHGGVGFVYVFIFSDQFVRTFEVGKLNGAGG